MDINTIPRKLWEHPNPESTLMWKFMTEANDRYGLNLKTFQDLYQWSCTQRSQFYSQLWDQHDWIYEGTYATVVDESIPISHLPRWFAGLRVNLAENFLWTCHTEYGVSDHNRRSTTNKEDDRIAITEIREGNGDAKKNVTWAELRHRVKQLAGALSARGVGRGDRVVMIGGHSVQTLVVFLAVSWVGGVFSSSSTDMGVGGLLQRTVQINPKFVFFDDGALYNGKVMDLREKIRGTMEGLKDCDQFQGMVVVQRFDNPYDTSDVPRTERLESFLEKGIPEPPIIRVDFQDPCTVYYSSGTTGTPKAIVHAVGPMMISLFKEGVLHRDINQHDVVLQYTTTGWIMYLLGVSYLCFGSRVVIYDGSPLVPDAKVLLRIVEEQKVSVLGIGPRWMGELLKSDVAPREEFDLSSLRYVISTGMVLSDQLFEWFYDVGFPKSVHLANISGGTDIAGCFALDNPLTPVYVGGCQGGSLGTPIAVYDHDLLDGSKGKPLPPGTPGDLVSPAAFPNMPICLWNDSSSSSSPSFSLTAAEAPGPKYRSSYFDRFEGVWAQGDFCVIHPLTGNVIMLGRSDGVLNPSGIRFGSADIYAVVEKYFAGEVRESICVGQRREKDLDERVFLFLLLKEGVKLDGALLERMRGTIGRELTKRHIPKYIFAVPEIPVTVNGKKVELPVKHIISGKKIKPSGTLLNPKSLEYFYRFSEVEKLAQPLAKL